MFLKSLGNSPFVINSLIMLVSNGSTWSTHFFGNHVCWDSSHNLFRHVAVTSRISSNFADHRLVSLTDAKDPISTSVFLSFLKLVLNVSILSSEKLPNRLANSKQFS